MVKWLEQFLNQALILLILTRCQAQYHLLELLHFQIRLQLVLNRVLCHQDLNQYLDPSHLLRHHQIQSQLRQFLNQGRGHLNQIQFQIQYQMLEIHRLLQIQLKLIQDQVLNRQGLIQRPNQFH